jgi:hypothetical protein
MVPIPPKPVIEDLRKIRQRLLTKEILDISNSPLVQESCVYCPSRLWPLESRLGSIARRMVSNDFDFNAEWNPRTQSFNVSVFEKAS